jgi:hypothetical protein
MRDIMKRYKPTKHLLQRRQEDPQGHRYSAAQASLAMQLSWHAEWLWLIPR